MSDAAEIYDAFAPDYRAYSEKKSTYIEAVDRLINQQFSSKISSILDFGAGDGVRGAALARKLGVARLVQADISAEMLVRCRQLGAAQDVWDAKQEWWNREEKFDLIICLWNVLGHIPSSDERVQTLVRLRGLLAPGGHLCFDVNNRHWRGYGRLRSLARRIIDRLYPDFSRGDVRFDWVIGDKTYPAQGHLFTMAEITSLLHASGFAIEKWHAVDYHTGAVSQKPSDGQLLVVARVGVM